MEKLRVTVLMQKDHRLGDNKFVEGVISGYIQCICKTFNERRWGIRDIGVGKMFTAEVTVEEYVELKNMITERYKDLCKFGIVRAEEI